MTTLAPATPGVAAAHAASTSSGDDAAAGNGGAPSPDGSRCRSGAACGAAAAGAAVGSLPELVLPSPQCAPLLLLQNPTTTTTKTLLRPQRRAPAAARAAVFRLCPEELLLALAFLPPLDLARAVAACRAFAGLAAGADEPLWRPHCAALWAGKQGYDAFLRALRDDEEAAAQGGALRRRSGSGGSLDAAARSARVAATAAAASATDSPLLRCALQLVDPRGAASARLAPAATAKALAAATMSDSDADDDDEPAAAPLRWSDVSAVERQFLLHGALAVELAHAASASAPGAPAPPVPRVTWRFALFASLREARRSALSKRDLLGGAWQLRFAATPHAAPQAVRFTPDNALVTESAGTLACQLAQGGTQLDVCVFPSLRVARRADDWGWDVRNRYVAVASRDVPVPLHLSWLRRNASPRPP